eukprot:SAG11_NODE_2717_length_3050_cov_2.389360_1_plen_70_part_00
MLRQLPTMRWPLALLSHCDEQLHPEDAFQFVLRDRVRDQRREVEGTIDISEPAAALTVLALGKNRLYQI